MAKKPSKGQKRPQRVSQVKKDIEKPSRLRKHLRQDSSQSQEEIPDLPDETKIVNIIDVQASQDEEEQNSQVHRPKGKLPPQEFSDSEIEEEKPHRVEAKSRRVLTQGPVDGSLCSIGGVQHVFQGGKYYEKCSDITTKLSGFLLNRKSYAAPDGKCYECSEAVKGLLVNQSVKGDKSRVYCGFMNTGYKKGKSQVSKSRFSVCVCNRCMFIAMTALVTQISKVCTRIRTGKPRPLDHLLAVIVPVGYLDNMDVQSVVQHDFPHQLSYDIINEEAFLRLTLSDRNFEPQSVVVQYFEYEKDGWVPISVINQSKFFSYATMILAKLGVDVKNTVEKLMWKIVKHIPYPQFKMATQARRSSEFDFSISFR